MSAVQVILKHCGKTRNCLNSVFYPFVCLVCAKKNFNIVHNFLMIHDRAFIFYIFIPRGKTLSLGSRSRSSVKVNVKYQGHIKKKKKNLAITFEWYVIELLYFTCVFLIVRPFLWYQGQGHQSALRSNKYQGVTEDHCFKLGCFPIQTQYLTTAFGRILFSSVIMVLACGTRGHWFKSCPDLIFLPCIHSFVSLLQTLFVRWGLFRDWPKSH